MGFLGSIGKDIGNILKPKNLIPELATAAGAYFGGPIGAAAGNALGDTITGQGVHPLNLAEAAGGAELGSIAGGGSANPLTSFQSGVSNAGDWINGLTNSPSTQPGTFFGPNEAGSLPPIGTSNTPGTFFSPGETGSLSTQPGTFLNPQTTTGQSVAALNGTAAGTAATPPGGLGNYLKGLMPTASTAIQGGLGVLGELNSKQAGKQLSATEAQLGNEASAAQQQAESLIQAGTSGQLPPGAQAQIQQDLDAQIASIKSNYGNMGLSGSSMEAQDINSARQRSEAQTFTQSQALATQGLQMLQASSPIYNEIMQAQLANDKASKDALSSFGEAFGLSKALGGASGNSPAAA